MPAAVNTFFRILSLLSIGFLVYEQLHETGATIASPASDPKDPFVFPFSIVNNSHLFNLRNVAWVCAAARIATERGETAASPQPVTGRASDIPAGRSLNIDCRSPGVASGIFDASLTISLRYDTDIFGLYQWHRVIAPTRFTWVARASNPQWVKGDFAR